MPEQVRTLEVGGAGGPLQARLYGRCSDVRLDLLLVFFHGGGFVGGSLEQSHTFLSALAGCGEQCLVLAPAYTLAGAAPFPAAVEDAHAVVSWAHQHRAALGWTGKQMVVAGIEAGANLAAVCAMMARDRGAPRLAGQILIMPMLDPGLSRCSMRALPLRADGGDLARQCAAGYRSYLPDPADRSHPYASPLQSSRLKGLAPALILSAHDDPLCDEASEYSTRLLECGVPTTLVWLSAAALQAPGARDACACQERALLAVRGFLGALAPPS